MTFYDWFFLLSMFPRFIYVVTLINTSLLFLNLFLKNFIYWLLERWERREKKREKNISVWLPLPCPHLGTWPTTQACALTGNRTRDSLVCRPVLNPLSHTSQGSILHYFLWLKKTPPLYRSQFVYPLISWWSFSLFELLIIMNNVAMNMCVQGFLCPYAGPYSNSMFNTFRNCQAIFQSEYTILQSHQQYYKSSKVSTFSLRLTIVFLF